MSSTEMNEDEELGIYQDNGSESEPQVEADVAPTNGAEVCRVLRNVLSNVQLPQ